MTVRFGGITAVRDVSLEIRHGEIVGIIGPNGAGKTSLLNAISRLVEASGQVQFQGRSLEGVAPHKLRGLGLARSFQKPQLEHNVTIAENIAAGLAFRRSYGLWSAGLRLPAMRKAEAAIQQAATAAGQEFQMDEWLPRRAGNAPNGIQKITDVARATMGQPALVLLDEPFAGLNGDEKKRLTAVLSARRADKALTLLVIDHDIDLMVQFCDRLCAMSEGQLKISGPPDEVISNPTVMNSYLGLALDVEVP